ncbi:MAG: GntR family transcriptional regulator [Chitinivibrionales bacterium]|nr:GntR family transcriptional regulator [Chitinivibrionales bacterium]
MGVSINSMCTATQLLKRKGVLSGLHGQPCCVNELDVAQLEALGEEFQFEQPGAAVESYRWQQIREQLRRDILNRTCDAGLSLPDNLALQQRYHVSYATLHKALQSLVREGLLAPVKSRYRIVTQSTAQSGKRVIFFMLTDARRNLALSGQSTAYYRAMEAECAKAGVKMETVGYFWGNLFYERDKQTNLESLPDDDTILGYVFLLVAINVDTDPVLRQLSHVNKPLAALNYLHKKSITVPQQLSLIGFDDTLEAVLAGLSSYNFNMTAMAHRMLGFVLNMRSVPRTRRVIEVDGMVVERLTTGKCVG